MLNQEQKIVGLAGSIACGKSAVEKFLIEAGVPVIDADQIARDVVKPDSLGLQLISEVFGTEYLNEDGSINRSKLGSLVFNNQSKLDLLNSILHPLIDEERCKRFVLLKEHPIIIWSAALIIEEGKANQYRPLIVVSCPPEVQLERLMKRNSLTESEARARIDKQLRSKEKEKFADFVIQTTGSLGELKEKTLTVLASIKKDM